MAMYDGPLSARDRVRPITCPSLGKAALGCTGLSALSTAEGTTRPGTSDLLSLSARDGGFSSSGVRDLTGLIRSARGGYGGSPLRSKEDETIDLELAASEALFFRSDAEKERVQAGRRKYPKRASSEKATRGGIGSDLLPSEGDEEDMIPRRIMGFGLGFEKIFATTSIKLPVSAYTVYVELRSAHNEQVFSRCFNGLHTVFDLKKWVYEKLLVPMNSYDMSYAEPGKATLTDQLRLLTTQDSLDTRTLATTRAVHRMYKGIPGVHSIGDVGVTRLYLRLKCRNCGDLLNSLQTCRKFKSFGPLDPVPDQVWHLPDSQAKGQGHKADDPNRRMTLAGLQHAAAQSRPGACEGIPGLDPTIEDLWYAPDQKKHCLFHTRGYEYFEAARTHGGHAELARIYISCGKEPSKKLKVGQNVLAKKGPNVKISY